MLHNDQCNKIFSNKVIDVAKAVSPIQPDFVTLEAAKRWIKMEAIDDDDLLIQDLLTQLLDYIEVYCGISVRSYSISAIVEIHNRIELPYGPVTAVSGITDQDGNALDLTKYMVGPAIGFPRIKGYGLFTVDYNAGYTNLPGTLQLALQTLLAFVYERRGDNLLKDDQEFAPIARKLLSPFKRNIGV